MTRSAVAAWAGCCTGLLLVTAVSVVSGQPRDRLTPTPEDLERLRVSVEPGPVVMVNLLKFRTDGGREAYQRYAAIAGPLFERAGAEIIYAGNAGPLVAEGRTGTRSSWRASRALTGSSRWPATASTRPRRGAKEKPRSNGRCGW